MVLSKLCQINFNNLSIVQPCLIPKGEKCPLDDLVALLKLAIHMENICTNAQGIGLSATQLGIPINFFIVKYDNYRYFVNCSYEPLSTEKITGVEGCLSILDNKGEFRFFEVERFNEVRIFGKELLAEPTLSVVDLKLSLKEHYSRVFQHELDHSSQILISDIGKEVYLWRT